MNMPTTKNSFEGSGFALDKMPIQKDVQVSKVLTTKKGNKIRAVLTTGGNVILTAAEEPNGNIIVLTGKTPTALVGEALSALWDAVKEAAKGIESLFSCAPVVTTTIKYGKDG